MFLLSSSLLVSSAEPTDHDRDKYETSHCDSGSQCAIVVRDFTSVSGIGGAEFRDCIPEGATGNGVVGEGES